MISILAIDPSFGGSQNVKKALSVLDETVLICTHPDKWRRRPKDTIDYMVTAENAKRCAQIVRASRFVFLAGSQATWVLARLPGYEKWIHDLNWAVWVTDALYRNKPELVNALLVKWGCETFFVLPNDTLIPNVPKGAIPLVHPFSLEFPGAQPETLTIMHSPGSRAKRGQKGSATIERVIQELQTRPEFEYKCLMGLPYTECLEQKTQAHIFIDSLASKHHIGLGKSGYEAMASEAVTISAMHDTAFTNPYFDAPPVLAAHTGAELEKVLAPLIAGGTARLRKQGQASRAWIKKYWGLENGAWLKYFRRFADL